MSAPKGSSTRSQDIAASLVVFLVALPLSIGIAVASGAPVRAGLVAAVIGGVVVGLLGGAPLQVSGPAAGLTVMVYGYVGQFGFEATCAIAILAGLMQVLAGAAGIARAAMAISPAVLQAMLAGIGVLIALGQVHVLFGAGPKSSALLNLSSLPETIRATNVSALTVGLFTMAVLLGWNKTLAHRIPFLPASLVAILAGTGLSLALPAKPPLVEVPDNVLTAFTWPSLGGHSLNDLALAAVALGFVASCESLLCAVATDQLHSGPRANLNRELLAQGAGNVLSGALGGLPVTGVIVRSSANIAAGGKTRLSAILHGVWMLVFVAFFASFLGLIPRAALAALLVQIGVKLVKFNELRKVAQFREAAVYAATLLGVVFINLLWGIGIGVALALVMLLRQISRTALKLEERDGEIQATLSGALSFLTVPSLSAQLSRVPTGRTVRLQLDVQQIDHAAIEAIRAWCAGYERAGGKIIKQPLETLWRELAHSKPADGRPQKAKSA